MLARLALAAAVVAVGVTTACSNSSAGSGQVGTQSTSAAQTSASAFPSTSTPSTTPSSSTAAVPNDWAAHVNFAAQAHPDMNCTPAGLGGKVDVTKLVSADVTGDAIPDAIVRAACAHSASEWPDSVYVYSDASGTPTLVATLVNQKASVYVPSITPANKAVQLGLVTWSKFAAGCCPDLNYTQTFSWSGTGYVAGPRIDVVKPCGDTAFTTTASAPQGAAGHGSLDLVFVNRLPQACTIVGYPGLDAVNASGGVLAHAKRSLNGYSGGAHAMKTLTVQPGQAVSARVEWLNFNPATAGACTFSKMIEVTPANTTNTVELPSQVSICGLKIHPTVAGVSGTD